MAPRGSNKKSRGTTSSNTGSNDKRNENTSDNNKEKIELDDEPNSGFSKYLQSEQGKVSIYITRKKKLFYTLIFNRNEYNANVCRYKFSCHDTYNGYASY